MSFPDWTRIDLNVGDTVVRIGSDGKQERMKVVESFGDSDKSVRLHNGGLYREDATIIAVNVSCGRNSIGLLVQDAKGFSVVHLDAGEAAHIAKLLADAAAKLSETH